MNIKNIIKHFLLVILLLQISLVSAHAEVIDNWFSTQKLPLTAASTVATSFNGKLYLFGGANTTDFSQVYISIPDLDGAVSQWNLASPSLPQTRYWSAIAQRNNRVYLVGGASLQATGNFVNTVYSSVIESDGSIGVWQSFSSLPDKLGMGAATIVNNRIYYAGGFNNSGISKKVYSAPLNQDGSLGSWVESGEMPEARQGLNMLSHNGYLLILGGYNGSYISTVYKTVPAGNGNISSWQETTDFPFPVYRPSSLIIDNKLIVAGGALALSCSSCGAFSSTRVYYGNLNSTSGVDEWVLSESKLPTAVHAASMIQGGEYLYLIGGYSNDGEKYLDTVYSAKLKKIEKKLDVPIFKQTDSRWGKQVYDSANIWQPTSPGIDASGCALTSAAMVFNYHGINKLPDGSVLTPGTLNIWLKNNKGYVGGYVSWMSLADLSEKAKSVNPSFLFNSLEYSRKNGFAAGQLKKDIDEDIPGILEVPGHFIVGKGYEKDKFIINDPFYNRNSLTDYGDTFLSLGRFVPQNSDVSYLEVAVDDGLSIFVKNRDGQTVGEGFKQQPYSVNGIDSKNKPLYFYYVPKPNSGIYEIAISSGTPKLYTLTIRLHDQDGNLIEKIIKGIRDENDSDRVKIDFNKVGNKDSSIVSLYSFETLINDLDSLYAGKYIANLGVYKSLREHAVQARKNETTNKKLAGAIMGSFGTILQTNRKKTISEDAYQILNSQVVYLLSILK